MRKREGKKRGEGGGKEPKGGIFQHGFLSISACLSKGEPVPGLPGWAGELLEKGLKSECGKSGGEEPPEEALRVSMKLVR